MKKSLLTVLGLLIVGSSFLGCKKDNTDQSPANSAGISNSSGRSTAIPAYYDSTQFTIFFAEFSPTAEANQIAHNNSLNNIWQSDPGLPGGLPFISVIDAIPHDGMNPVWRESQIAFINGHTPRQLYSDNEVYAAQTNGEISITLTNEVYWCPVVNH